MHSSPRAGAVTKPGGQRRVSMKISDAPVASKAGKTQQKAVFFLQIIFYFFVEVLSLWVWTYSYSNSLFVQLSTYSRQI